jgi:hypothetical protein
MPADIEMEAGSMAQEPDESSVMAPVHTPAPAPLTGKVVRLEGLQARPDLNGRTGTVVRFVTERGRYQVELDATDETTGETSLAVRVENLKLVHGEDDA